MSTATTKDGNNNDIIKLSLAELLTRQYKSISTFLFDNETPPLPPSTAMQTNKTKKQTIPNDIKSLNCTKLSLQIVKALLSSTTNSGIDAATNDANVNEHTNHQQLSTNDFPIKIKLNNDGNYLILLDASYNPATAIGQGVAIQYSIQSIGHLLHAIFTESPSSADSTKQSLLQQKSSVVSEESDIAENSNKKGGKDLRIAKVRRSQTNTLFATLCEFKQ